MKNSMNDVSQSLSLQNQLYYANISFFFFPLNNKDNQKKHLQEAQKAYRWRAGISLPWLSQSRRAVLAEDGAGWLCPDPFQNWTKFHKGTIRSANVPSFSGEIWPYLLGFLP